MTRLTPQRANAITEAVLRDVRHALSLEPFFASSVAPDAVQGESHVVPDLLNIA